MQCHRLSDRVSMVSSQVASCLELFVGYLDSLIENTIVAGIPTDALPKLEKPILNKRKKYTA